MSLSGHRSVFTHHSAGLDYAGRHPHHPRNLPLMDIKPVAMVAAERAHRDHHLVELTVVKVGNLEQRAVGVDADHTELGLVVHFSPAAFRTESISARSSTCPFQIISGRTFFSASTSALWPDSSRIWQISPLARPGSFFRHRSIKSGGNSSLIAWG